MSNRMIVLGLLALVIAAAGPVYCFTHWSSLPDQMPAHFNAAGDVDNWGPKGDPIIMLIPNACVFLLFTLLEGLLGHFQPSMPEAKKAMVGTLQLVFALFKIEMLAVLSFVEYSIVQVAANHGGALPPWLAPVFFACFFLTLAILLVSLVKSANSKA